MEFTFLGNTYDVAEFRELVVGKYACKEALDEYDACNTTQAHESVCQKYFAWLNRHILEIYDATDNFSEGLARVKKEGKCSFIDTTGKEVIPFIYDEVYAFSEGLARVRKNDKYGFINTKGEEIVPCIYDWVYNFKGGFAEVKRDWKFLQIDTTGKV